MKTYNNLLAGNKLWVKEKLEQDPQFFDRLSKGQSPEVLRIWKLALTANPNYQLFTMLPVKMLLA